MTILMLNTMTCDLPTDMWKMETEKKFEAG